MRRLECRGEWLATAHLGTAFDHRRTVNIWNMSLTLAVSKLIGWLNDIAYCRVSGGVLLEGRMAQVTWCCAKCEPGDGQGPCTQLVCREQTTNIPAMLVTLEVSKFSGWLNADAFCEGSGLGLGSGLG